jgi:hypothetical protein
MPPMPVAAFLPPNNNNGTNPVETPEQERQRKADRKAFVKLGYQTLINLYILADKLLDPTTANMAIDEIRRFGESVGRNLGADDIILVFDSTTEGDGLRKLLADFIIYTGIKLPEGDMPKDFFKFVLQRYLTESWNKRLYTRHQFGTVVGKVGWADSDYYQDVGSDQEE